MTRWYTADLHLGHEAILRHCGRPFRSAGEMDAALLAALRAAVGSRDELWILGDLAFGPRAKDPSWLARLFRRLPGARRHLVTGNHDGAATRALPWDTVTPLAEITDEGTRLVLCHYPMITWPGARRGAIHLFGHVHDNWAGCRGAVNVGVDLWGFRPVTVAEIVARATTLPINPLWDEIEPGLEAGPPVMRRAVPDRDG